MWHLFNKKNQAGKEWEKFVETVYQSSVAQHPDLKKIPEEKIKAIIKTAVEEIAQLEELSYHNGDSIKLNREETEKISAVWVFSGPGNYDQPVTHPRYKDYSWTKGMDKDRVDYGISIVQKIKEVKGGDDKVSPCFIYNGEKEQNEEVRKVLASNGEKIPKSKLWIIDGDIHNTVDQTKIFSLPPDCSIENKEIALVSHAPHLVRIMHMINRYQPIPKKMFVRIFPVKTPAEAQEAYTVLEIRGLLYYIFLSANHDATEESYPYHVHGA